MPIKAPAAPVPAAINRLWFETVVDFPPQLTGELLPDGTPEVSLGHINFKYQTKAEDGTPSGWTDTYHTSDLPLKTVQALIGLMTETVTDHATESGLALDLKPLPAPVTEAIDIP